MSLAGVVDTFATGTYTVTRTAAGTRTLGVYTPGATATFTVAAAMQPISGRELRVLADGFRAQDVRVLYLTTPLKVEEPECDSVTIEGEAWRAFKCERWDVPIFGYAYYRVLVSRVAQP